MLAGAAHGEARFQALAQQSRAAALVAVSHHAARPGPALGRIQAGDRRAGQVVDGLLARGRRVGQPVVTGVQPEPGGQHGIEAGERDDVAVGHVAHRPGTGSLSAERAVRHGHILPVPARAGIPRWAPGRFALA